MGSGLIILDVKERFEEFFSRIYGTGEIKMVAEPAPER